MDIIEAEESHETYKMFGDALMRVNEPEDASKAYI